MNKLHGVYIFLLILLLVYKSNNVYTQTRTSSNLISKAKYQEDIKIYTDRDFYIAGEKIWFSAFSRTMPDGRSPGISSVIYIELLNRENFPEIQVKFKVDHGKASGSIQIPLELKTGQYLIRAYTNALKKFGSKHFYYKELSILNPFENLSGISVTGPESKCENIKIFPEGSTIVSGKKNLVVVQTTNSNNKGSEAWVYLSANQEIIDSVKTDEYGWAVIEKYFNDTISYAFHFNSKPNKSYPLTSFFNKKIQIHLENETRDKLFFRIRSGTNFPKDPLKAILFKDETTLFMSPLELKKTSLITLEKKNLFPGMYRIALLTAENSVITDRYFLIDEILSNAVKMHSFKTNFNPREKVTLNIEAAGEIMHLNLKIVNSALDDPTARVEKFPVDSRLRNFNIWQAKYEINKLLACINGEQQIYSAHDNQDKNLQFPAEIDGSVISGRVINTQTGEALGNEELWLSVVGEESSAQLTATDSSGSFTSEVKAHGTGDLVIQPNDTSVNFAISLQSDFMNDFLEWDFLNFELTESNIDAVNQAAINMQLVNSFGIELNEKKKKSNDTLFFYGIPDNNIIVDEYIDLPVMEEIIREIVPYVFFRKKDNNYFLRISDKHTNFLYDDDPLILVDGVPVFNTNILMSMDPSELGRIEVVQKRYFLHNLSFDGIINFITHEQNFNVLDPSPDVFRQSFAFPEHGKRFTAPEYGLNRNIDDPRPDFRNTLYWDPDIKLDENGRTIIEFYTGDATGEYSIVMEGIDASGRRIFLREKIMVK